MRNKPQRNPYHRYTVDRHLLEATANAATLAHRVERADLLLLGTLLHDIGKGFPGDHTEVGMVIAAEIGARLGLPPEDVATLVTMVRLHLLLPDVATRRDLDDPATAERVAREVGDRATLDLLASLVEADSIATGPSAWGPWKAGLVADLVERTAHLLAGEPVAPPTPWVTDELRMIMDTVRDRGVPALSIEDPVVTVAAPDRPGLLAEVTGVLALHGLNVRSAVVAGEEGVAVEMFTAEPSLGRWPAAARLSDDLAAAHGRTAPDRRPTRRASSHLPEHQAARCASAGLDSGHRGQQRVDGRHSGRSARRGRRRPAPPHHPSLRRVPARRHLGEGLHLRQCGRRRLLRAVRGRRQARRHTGDRSPRTNDRRGGGGPSRGVGKAPNGKVPVWSAGPTGSLSTGKQRLGCEDRFAMESKHAHAKLRAQARRTSDPAYRHRPRRPRRHSELGSPQSRTALTRRARPRDRAALVSPPKALTVVSVSPANGTSGVPSDATLSVQFSAPLALHTPTPTLTPPVAGSWELVAPTTLAFVASSPLVPSSTETISVPAGSGGVSAASGNHLTLASTTQFTVAAGSTLRLQQLLAQLGYLPLSFTPAGPLSAPQEAANAQKGPSTGGGPSRPPSKASGRRVVPTRSPGAR